MPEFKDELQCRLHKDHKNHYEDLIKFERMLELAKIEFRRVLRECTTTIEIRDAQTQQLRAEIEALKAQNQCVSSARDIKRRCPSLCL